MELITNLTILIATLLLIIINYNPMTIILRSMESSPLVL